MSFREDCQFVWLNSLNEACGNACVVGRIRETLLRRVGTGTYTSVGCRHACGANGWMAATSCRRRGHAQPQSRNACGLRAMSGAPFAACTQSIAINSFSGGIVTRVAGPHCQSGSALVAGCVEEFAGYTLRARCARQN